MSKYAYARVSSRDQNEDRQLAALQKPEIPRRNISQKIRALTYASWIWNCL